MVTIKVYDTVHTTRHPHPGTLKACTPVFTLSFYATNEMSAVDIANFANDGFSLANVQHANDYYAGLRAAYFALRSAFHFSCDPYIHATISEG